MSDAFSMAAVGIVLGAWLLGGAWAVWTGMAMRRRAEESLRQTARLGRLIETAPAIPLIVRLDGKVDTPDRLLGWLGIERKIGHLSDLSTEAGPGGFAPEDVERLSKQVGLVQRTGKSFEASFAVEGSDRALGIKGALADSQIYPNGAALLWFFDRSESHRDQARLAAEADAARRAFHALSGLIEAAPLPMWHRAPDGSLMLVNDAFVQAVGGASAEDVVAAGAELIETGEGRSPAAVAQEATDKGVTITREIAVTIEGDRRHMMVVDVPIGDVGVAGYAIEMQELAEARAKHRSFVSAQRDMLDAMSSGVVQFDGDGSAVFANLPFRRMFGMDEEWLAEQPDFARVLDRMRDAGRSPEVRDFGAWRSERQSWFQSAEPVQENWLLPDNTHLRVLAQPTPDAGLLLIFEDRTEQARLASSRDTLLRVRTATLNNLFEGIAVFGSDGSLNLWNERFAEIWETDEKALAGHPHIDKQIASLARRLVDPSKAAVMRETVRAATERRARRDGALEFSDGRHFRFSTLPLPDGNALFAMLDISDSQRIERALRERNEALTEADAIKGRFLANMSYEFRTPLTSIQGFAEMLAAGLAGELGDQAKEYVGAILQSVERLSGQINTVLDLSQGEAGALPIDKQPLKIAELLGALTKDHRADALAAGIDLRLDIRGSAGTVPADQRRLRQALDHVLGNALAYAGTDAAVLVFADGGQHSARIVISDNGPGMDAKAQARALNRLEADAAAGSGGLGLPFARQLVEAHGGSLELISQEGEGTMITIELPRL